MKKYVLLLAGAVFATPTPASAMHLEAGGGVRWYTPTANGTWYQKGLPYNLRLTGLTGSVGVTGRINRHLRWSARYVYLGLASSNSLDTGDPNYNPQTQGCNGKCWPLANFTGHGTVQGFAFVLQPQVALGSGVHAFLEAGPWVYRPTWHMQVDHWVSSPTAQPVNLTINHDPRWQLGWVCAWGAHRWPWTYTTPVRWVTPGRQSTPGHTP